MSEARMDINWAPPGPVSEAFMRSMAKVQIINGPVGGGKTTTAFIKAVRLACAQRISKGRTINIGDGERPVRKFKLAIVRDTYRQLHKTTIPSWHKRFPPNAGEWTGAMDAPCRHRLHFLIADGSVVDFTAEFAAIGDNSVEDFMRGFEPTAWYLNELDLLSRDVFTYAKGRWGRFPDMSEGGPSWFGILADCNAPELESWLYRDIFTKSAAELKMEDTELFIQPGGLEPGAENTVNLPPDYYEAQSKGQPEFYVERMIKNRPGYSRAGKPVVPEFKNHIHVAKADMLPIHGLPLVIGVDPRTFPSAAFLQRNPGGQRRVVDELQGDQNMGPRRFGDLVAQMLHDRYPFVKPDSIKCVVDPSAQYGKDMQDDESKSWLEIFSNRTGLKVEAAPTNSIDVRREALKKPLTTLIDGDPALIVSPHCKLIITGLNSGFRFKKLNVGGADRFAEDVEKNNYADICEALEYACLTDGADVEIMERKGYTSQSLLAARRMGEDRSSWDADPLHR